MAAYAALASLLNTVQDIINHPKISTYFFKKHPHILLNKTSWLLDFVEANNYGEEAEDLEREITSAAQAAEDVIDSHIMNQIYAVRRRRRPLDLIKKIHNMDVVMKKANDFKGKRSSREEQGATFPVAVMDIEETSMVGLDAELKELLYELTRDPKSNRQTISIVGMGGTGKTTLAKNIYENNLIKHHFDFRGWASISQQHKAREILVQLLLQIADFKKDRITRARSILASSLSGQPIKQGLAYGESIGNSIRWELPTFVSLMWNLQYLIIKTHSIDAVVEAPCEIWKMRQLRHVDCKNIYLPPNNRQDQNELLVLSFQP